MKLQKGAGTCGAAVIVNCLRVFGKKLPQKRIESLAGTTKEGTDENGILTALAALSYVGLPYQGTSKVQAIEWLDEALDKGPVILNIMQGDHWIAIIAKCVNNYVLVDSTNTKRNIKENGVHIVNKRELVRLWFNKDSKLLYGISVSEVSSS